MNIDERLEPRPESLELATRDPHDDVTLFRVSIGQSALAVADTCLLLIDVNADCLDRKLSFWGVVYWLVELQLV